MLFVVTIQKAWKQIYVSLMFWNSLNSSFMLMWGNSRLSTALDNLQTSFRHNLRNEG